MTILELREKRAKAWEAAKDFLDSHRNEKGVLSAEDDAAYTRMEQEITDLGKEIARLERQEAFERELSPAGESAPDRTSGIRRRGKGKDRACFGGIQGQFLECHALYGAASQCGQCFGGRDGFRGWLSGAG